MATDYTGNIAQAFHDYGTRIMARQELALRQQELGMQQRQLDEEHAQHQQSAQLALGDLLRGGARPVDAQGNVSVTSPTPTASWNPNATTGADGLPQGRIMTGLDMNNGPQVSLPADQGRVITVGGKQAQIPTLSDQMLSEAQRQRTLGDSDPNRVAVNDQLADAVGLPRGSHVNVDHLAGLGALAHYNGLLQKPANNTPTVLQTIQQTDDRGNVHVAHLMSDGTTVPVQLPADFKGKSDKYGNADGGVGMLTAYELARQARDDAKQKETERVQATNDYKGALKEESAIHDQRSRLGAALTSKTYYIDNAGQPKPFGIMSSEEKQGLLQDMQQRYQDATNRLPDVLARKNDAIQRAGSQPRVSTDQAMGAIQKPTSPSQLPPAASTAVPPARQAAAVAAGSPGPSTIPGRSGSVQTSLNATAPKPGASTPAATLPAKAVAQLKPGTITTFHNGQQWTLGPDNKPLQITAK